MTIGSTPTDGRRVRPDQGPRTPTRTPTGIPAPRGSAGRALLRYLREQIQVVHEQDPRVRENAPDAVHKMRTATRRLRSALASYRNLLDRETADRLRGELRWLAGVLGIARDAEVLHARLRGEVSADATLASGVTAEAIDELFGRTVQTTQLTVLDVLDSERYAVLLRDLAELLAHPSLSAAARLPARRVARNEIDADVKRLRRAVGAVKALPDGPERDHALHEVRKRAKRLRYAAEAAVTIDPKRATRMVEFAQSLQESLGEHQDSVVAREALLSLAADAQGRGEDTFGFGRLHALEEVRAAAAEARFRRNWSAMLRAL